jgi:RecA-family ATPase
MMTLNPILAYEPRDPVELVKGLLVADVSMLVGKKGSGKSQMVAHWAACITDGKEFVPGVRPSVRGEAVIFHGERSIESALLPRLIAAGVTNWRETVHLPRVETLKDVVETLTTLIAQHKKIRIVFIDPLNAYLDGKSPTNPKARKLLKPLLALCERCGICIVFVCHFTKGGDRDLVDLIGGSGGWSQAACSIWVTAKVRDGCLLQHLECNVLPTDGQCWEYTIEPETLDVHKYPERTKPTSRVVILGKSDVDVQTALKLGKDMAISCVPNAMFQIEQLLKGQGPKRSADVVKHLTEQGITRATWKRAQDTLHKEGSLAYIANGRTTLWKWIGTESESESDDIIEEWESGSSD